MDPTVASLNAAATAGDLEALQQAIGNLHNGPSRSHDLGRALAITMDRSHVACFRILLQSGAAFNLSDTQGNRLIHIASREYSHVPFLEILIEQGASLEARNDQEQTPLHIACSGPCIPAAQLLINSGAALESRDRNGNTALHCACLANSVYLMEMLLENGARPEAENNNRERALHLACILNFQQCAKYLLSRGARPNLCVDITRRTNLHWACMMENGIEYVQALLLWGAHPDAKDKKGRTPLHMLCQRESLDVLDVLLGAGADAKIVDYKGKTAVYHAVTSHETSAETQTLILNSLINAGADPKLPCHAGQRPQDVAVHSIIKYALEIF
ncbi:unnamed protein product [Microthlaspi erraticum]|uniref:Uncharacterized protein n=1 Tax=Microthlaspi erraticum TaxID=1685480 RepID=A0A6D2LFS6_9BRAS|nr:unnamed protein product [Microthlaspi erraticum]